MAHGGFFKVLLDDFHDRLPIPRRFVKDLNNIAENMDAKIRVLGGKCFWVKIIWDVGPSGYFYGEGWKKIIHECDLKYGYFLVFDYHGDLTFDLTVFDYSGCSKVFHEKSNKECCSSGKTVQQFNLPMDIVGDEGYQEIGKTLVCARMKCNTTSSREKTCKKRSLCPQRRSTFFKKLTLLHLLGKSLMTIPISFDSSKYLNGRSFVWLDMGGKGLSWKVKVIRDGERLRLGGGFAKFGKDNNIEEGDVCQFKIKNWKKNDIDITFHVNIMEEEEHACQFQIKNPKKNDSNRTFPVNFRNKGQLCPPIRNLKKNAADNMDVEEVKLQTIIDLVDDDDDDDDVKEISAKDNYEQVEFTTNRSHEKVQKERASLPQWRYVFLKTITQSHLLGSSKLNLPPIHGSSKYLDNKSFVWLKIGDKGWSWKINLLRHRRRSFFRLGRGFAKFCTENDIKEGDVCQFEMKNWKKNDIHATFHVNVMKEDDTRQSQPVLDIADDELYPEIGKELICARTGNPSEITERVRETKEATSLIRSKFQSTLKSSHIWGRALLHIPTKSFDSRKYLDGKSFVFLSYNGRQRRVRILFDKVTCAYRFGWDLKKFCHENNVEDGNVFEFEMKTWKRTDVVATFHVRILKNPCNGKSNGYSGQHLASGEQRMMKSTTSKSALRPQCRSMFVKKITLGHVLGKSQMRIPTSFDSPKYLDSKSSVWLKIGDGGLPWKINLVRYGRIFSLGGGFAQFCKQNDVKEGNSCRFEIKNWEKENVHTTFHVNVIEQV